MSASGDNDNKIHAFPLDLEKFKTHKKNSHELCPQEVEHTPHQPRSEEKFASLARTLQESSSKPLAGWDQPKVFRAQTEITFLEKQTDAKSQENLQTKLIKSDGSPPRVSDLDTINISPPPECLKSKNPSLAQDPYQLLQTTIDNKYLVVKLLGQGGVATVYLGHHKLLGQNRAIKVLPRTHNDDIKAIQRFFHEARAASLVDHPNVVRIFDIDKTQTFYFIVMEYVEGKNLEMYVRGRPLPVENCLHYVKEAALGLAEIHKAELIHRDIKPNNLLLSSSGKIKITDFGIVKDYKVNVTTANTIVGTPQYMSPEQIINKDLDARSDMYSLGATFYYLATGRPCFTGTVMQIMKEVLRCDPVPPHQINLKLGNDISQIILKMMAKDPAARYPDMITLCDILDKCKS